MKSKILMLLGVGLLMILLSGCYKDIISPGQDPNGPPQPVSFSGDLVPLFTANCATSGCHDGVATSHNPALNAEKAFTAITSGGYINILVPQNSILYSSIKSGSMPPSGALKSSDMQKVLDWIRNGAPNN